MSTPRIVGAYAALPAERSDQEEFYRLLADRGVTGIEIPYANALHDDLDWFAERIAPFGNSVVTAIPGTMGRVGQDPEFGLASTTTGRDRGLAFIAQILADIEKLHDKVGPVVRWLQVHSAPSDQCDAEAFATSLAQVCHWVDSLGVTPVVEHCDARGHHEGEKRFLSFEEELEVCQALDVRMTINWGRSVLESHDPATPLSHVRALVDAGLLGGLMFSGIGPEKTQYGPAWGDAHLPLSLDEPTSLMTPDRVSNCYRAAEGQWYEGAKIQVPNVSPSERVAIIGHILDAMN